MPSIFTEPEEFKRFHELLTKDAPDGYQPFYFPLEKNGKDPLKGCSWKTNRKTFQEAYKLMQQGFNIGIAATDKDPLVIVDIDDLSKVKDPKPTLINLSRKRIGRHCFYFTDDPLARTIFDSSAKQNIATEDAGEVRSAWQYVVAAGSFVPCAPEELDKIPIDDIPNAGKYSVMVEHSVTKISYIELPEIFRICTENKRAIEISNRQKKIKQVVTKEGDTKNKSKLWSLSIYDVTGKRDDPTHRFPSMFHGSKTYKDTSISQGMLHCWRHNVSHSALTFLAVEAGVSNCSGAGYGHNGSGRTDVDFDDPKTVYSIWLHAKNKGYIPDNDPMPTKAMVYYALEMKMCDPREIVDGWKLPSDVFNKIIETASFNVGREKLKTHSEKMGQVLQKTMLNPMQIALTLQGVIQIYYDNARNYWMWNEQVCKYERVDETEIMCQISACMDLTIYQSKIKQEILEAIRNTGRTRRVKIPKKGWIQFRNGVIDIETGELFKATPDYFFASPIPHSIGDSEDTPAIDSLFKSWLNDKTDLLVEICAYCLYSGYPIQRIFAIIGSGSNGKGQFMTLLRRLLGSDNCVGTDLDRLTMSRFEVSKLFNKKAAFIGETNYNTLNRTNMLKQLSGGDLVSAEFKGRDPFDFVNAAKILIATNGLPATTDHSDGFYRRWCIIEFKNKFKDGKSVVDEIPEKEYENFCRKCIRILKEILAAGHLPHEEDASDRMSVYEKMSNPIQAFIQENMEIADDAFVPVWYMYEQFDSYRQKRGYRKISKKEFSNIIQSYDHEKKPKWYSIEEATRYVPEAKDEKTWWSFIGLRMKPCVPCVTDVNSYLPLPLENQVENNVRYASYARKNEETSKESSEISPLQLLDQLIIETVNSEYKNGYVPDACEFERNFCEKYPIYRGSMVKARLAELKHKT